MKSGSTDVAYEHIRRRILNGVYGAGQSLQTEVLAAAIGVSRTPVRDALRRLESDGVVVIRPRQGAHVKRMELPELRELCELRLALETQTAGLAAQRRTDVDLQEMAAALAMMSRLTPEANAGGAEGVGAALGREDVRFHLAIMNAAKNELIKKQIMRLQVINRVAWSPFGEEYQRQLSRAERARYRKETLRAHRLVYQAIARGDAVQAKRAMERHIQSLIDLVTRTLAGQVTAPALRALTAEELAYLPV